MTLSRTFLHTIATLIACAMLVFSTAACTGSDPQPTPADTTADTATPTPAVSIFAAFLPQSGFTLSDSTPLGSWNTFTAYLKESAQTAGFTDDTFTMVQNGTLADQYSQLEKYLEENETVASGIHNTTILFIPAGLSTRDSRRCSDLIMRPTAASPSASPAPSENDAPSGTSSDSPADEASLAPTEDTSPSPADTPAGDAPDTATSASSSVDSTASESETLVPSASASPSDSSPTRSPLTSGTPSTSQGSGNSKKNVTLQDVERLLKAAVAQGASLIVPQDVFSDVEATLFIDLPTARSIGRLQAQFVVTKLRLSSSTISPRAVEILLPYEDDVDFVREAFEGIWDVIGPYFTAGRVYSPSGLLSASASADSWWSVAFEARNSDDVKNELTARLDASDYSDVSHMAVDAVICVNDMAATGAVDGLRQMEYTGSSATINPGTSLPSVVDTLTGRRDVSRAEVPAPAASGTPSASASADVQEAVRTSLRLRASRDSSAWPLVTGYGCYKSVLPGIVTGSQWLTGLEDMQGYANDCVRAADTLNSGGGTVELYNSVSSLTQHSDGYALSRSLTGIHAANIKTALIDKGYATAADAGI